MTQSRLNSASPKLKMASLKGMVWMLNVEKLARQVCFHTVCLYLVVRMSCVQFETMIRDRQVASMGSGLLAG